MVSGSGGDSEAMAVKLQVGQGGRSREAGVPNQTLLLPLVEGANASKQGVRVGALAAHR